jgi:hypothetical protein
MADIIRCPRCRTLVYDTASRCHGCDGRLKGGRLLTKGSWVFIFLATSAFGVIAGADILNDKQRAEWRARAERQQQVRLRATVQAWLGGDDAAVRDHLEARDGDLMRRLLAVRDAYCQVLPCDAIEDFRREQRRSVRMERVEGEPPHALEAVFDLAPKRVSRIPYRRRSGSTDAQAAARGPEAEAPSLVEAFCDRLPKSSWCYSEYGKEPNRVWAWDEDVVEYEVAVRKDDRRFRVLLAVHTEGGSMRALRVGRIEDYASGEVISPERP